MSLPTQFIKISKMLEIKNMGNRNIFLKGLKTLDVKLGELSFNLYPQAFFQINFDAALLMYDFIKSNINETDQVIDAYAGVSSIGQYIAKKAKKCDID